MCDAKCLLHNICCWLIPTFIGLNLSMSHYYKTVFLFNWDLGILYAVPWFTLHIFYFFFSSCVFSYKEKLGLDCSSDYVMQVVSSHISLFVLVPPSPFFLSALVCLFCARVISLHQKLFVALIERPEFCIRKWRIPLLFAVMKTAICWVWRAVTVPLGEWWCFF